MQFTKDSFYMALLERLVSLNPLQTVTLDGTTRPAIIVAENELVTSAQPVSDAFYIELGRCTDGTRPSGRSGSDGNGLFDFVPHLWDGAKRSGSRPGSGGAGHGTSEYL